MVQNTWEKIQALTAQLNQYRDEYYNSNAPSVSDAAYDRMYDELAALEKETGICHGTGRAGKVPLLWGACPHPREPFRGEWEGKGH